MPENITTWGQLSAYAVIVVVGIIWGVKQLFETMRINYTSVITDLQKHIVTLHAQNADQEKRFTAQDADKDKRLTEQRAEIEANHANISQLRQQIAKSDKDCDEKINLLTGRLDVVEQKTGDPPAR